MPKFVRARPPLDDGEARKIRRLAGARHAPGDWIERARIITLSWDGLAVPAIAAETGRHENTVRRWLHRFNAVGLDGLGDRPGAGRKRRITEVQRSAIIALARSVPPGRLDRDTAGELSRTTRTGRRSGPWTPWPRRPGTPASPWGAARSGGSCWPRRSAGGAPAAGPRAPTRTSSPKDPRRGALHRPAAGLHRHLRR
ncbi:MAG TPA: helix-turn-helix domain-containing protein [Streptosporangiaceae bacterium]|nr:helix-turn-helix domain-containing protein [Streptosporangiaceae bacterium]